MAGEPFCRSCGKMLQAGMIKCPDCGAPQGAAVAPRKGFSRSSAAGFMLVVAFTLGMFQGIFIVLEPELPAGQEAIYGTTFQVNGTARDEAGVPVSGVNVTYDETNVLTDANGSYVLPNVPSGVVDLRFLEEGRGNLTVRLFVYRAQTVDAELLPAGSADQRIDHDAYELVNFAFQICGFVLLGAALLSLLGGIAAYRRRSWGLALAGAIAALFVSPPLSLAVGAIAIYLVSRAKAEFVPVP